MNNSDFPKYGLTLEAILHRTNGDLQTLSIEELNGWRRWLMTRFLMPVLRLISFKK
jgi:hypothetical protein